MNLIHSFGNDRFSPLTAYLQAAPGRHSGTAFNLFLKLRPARTMVVDGYLGVLEVARGSDWAALIPMTGLLDEVANRRLWIYPIARPQLSFRWHLIHEQAKALSSAAKRFVHAVVTELAAKQALWKQHLGRSKRRRRFLTSIQGGAP